MSNLSSIEYDDKAWIFSPIDSDLRDQIKKALNYPNAFIEALLRRGFQQKEHIEEYLAPRLANLHSPIDMADLDRALNRIIEAITRYEIIGVFGDYDVDGVSSAALVADYLKAAGAQVKVRVATRDEGYGFHKTQVDEIAAARVKLLIVTDTGTHDHEAVAHAQSLGIDVIVIDHHLVGEKEFVGYALINPQRKDCGFPFKGLCAAGLSFYVMAALRRRLVAIDKRASDPRECLDLVALATLADVAPLKGDNRILVAHGLRYLKETKRPGLMQLMRLAEIEGSVSVRDVGWRIAPRLNAPGRLGDASVALECLYQRDEDKAVEYAQQCDELNEQRKSVQEAILEEAMKQAEADDAPFLIVSGDDWHPGVIGIVAGRLADRFARPTAVIAFEGDVGRASARSIEGINLVNALRSCESLLERFGGHAAAAGFSVKRGHLSALRDGLSEAIAEDIKHVGPKSLMIDSLIEFKAIDFEFYHQIKRAEPHGEGNPSFVFAAQSLKVENVYLMGADQSHLRLILSHADVTQTAIGFSMADRAPEKGSFVDIAFTIECDSYRGVERLRLHLVDIRPTR